MNIFLNAFLPLLLRCFYIIFRYVWECDDGALPISSFAISFLSFAISMPFSQTFNWDFAVKILWWYHRSLFAFYVYGEWNQQQSQVVATSGEICHIPSMESHCLDTRWLEMVIRSARSRSLISGCCVTGAGMCKNYNSQQVLDKSLEQRWCKRKVVYSECDKRKFIL